MGNGNALPISHVGDACVSTKEGKFKLNDMLVVPHLKKNLLSVGKSTSDNSCTSEFTSFDFVVKGQNKKIIERGYKKGQLHALDGVIHEPLSVIRKECASSTVWINDLDILIQKYYLC